MFKMLCTKEVHLHCYIKKERTGDLIAFLLASASVNIGQLEHQLILSVDPWRIRQILIELHGMTSERQFWTISNKVTYFMRS